MLLLLADKGLRLDERIGGLGMGEAQGILQGLAGALRRVDGLGTVLIMGLVVVSILDLAHRGGGLVVALCGGQRGLLRDAGAL